jgi:hypothetical protein
MLQGGPGNVPDEYRTYRLARMFGWTPTQIDEQPAALLDWLLMIDATVRQTETGS